MIFLRDKRPALSSIKQNSNTEKLIFISIIYFSSLILITAINQLMYSDKYKAAWIYFTTPIAKPGKIISGALKSLLVKFYLPIITLTFLGAILFEGPRVIPNLFLGLCNQLLIIFLILIALRFFTPILFFISQSPTKFILILIFLRCSGLSIFSIFYFFGCFSYPVCLQLVCICCCFHPYI
jgi:hypothetical protein